MIQNLFPSGNGFTSLPGTYQHDDVDYILYLRGRWKDVWQAYVIRNAVSLATMNENPAVWSVDVFKLNGIRCQAEQLELAKEILISMFFEFDGEFPELKQSLRNVK
jgi:hypothetical protein